MNHTESNVPPKLSYFLSQKKGILIASLIGPLSRETLPILEECSREIADSQAKWVILNFRDVSKDLEKPIMPAIAGLQKKIREMPADLKLVGLHPELRQTLERQGLLRREERAENLSQALQMIAPLVGRAA